MSFQENDQITINILRGEKTQQPNKKCSLLILSVLSNESNLFGLAMSIVAIG